MIVMTVPVPVLVPVPGRATVPFVRRPSEGVVSRPAVMVTVGAPVAVGAALGAEGCFDRADHVIEDMLRHLGAEVRRVEAPFRPEGGAYGHGRTHGHHHGGAGDDPFGRVPDYRNGGAPGDGHDHEHGHPGKHDHRHPSE